MWNNFLGAGLGLGASVFWGGADFCGGLAARRNTPLQVLVISSLAGIPVLLACAAIWQEPWPAWASVGWAALAGVCGVLGLTVFYQALASGSIATVAPAAGVIGAGLPVLFGSLTQGLPGPARLLGFALALPGLWLVSRKAGELATRRQRDLLMAAISGTGFGLYFILISQVSPGQVFLPLVAMRGSELVIAAGLLLLRQQSIPALTSNRLALLVGALDAGGNSLYMLAKAYARLDVAVVLSSLYPAFTVILAQVILKERAASSQWAGVILCLIAIALITL